MMEPSPPNRLVFPIVVWGESYVRTFLDIALPTFLCPGNLPYCAERITTTVIILTSPADAATIEASARFRFARSICNVEVRPVVTPELLAAHNKYGVMASSHHAVIKECEGTSAVISILSPDSVISDGCLRFALDKILGGCQAVLVAGPRAALQPFARSLPFGETDIAFPLSPRDIVSRVCTAFHPISKSVFFSARDFTTIPSCLYWSCSEESFLAKYFHLHPLMVRIRSDAAFGDRHTGTVDSTLVDDAAVASALTYVVEDSDELVVAELSNENTMDIPAHRRLNKTLFIYGWAKRNALQKHIENFLSYTFLFKGGDYTETAINKTINRMTRQTSLLSRLLRGINRP